MASILRAWNLVVGGARKITSVTLGTKEALCTTLTDASGKVPGESGYTGQPVQLVDENGNPVTSAEAIKLLDKDGTNQAVIDSHGSISITKKDSAGTASGTKTNPDFGKEAVIGTLVSGATDPNITFDLNATTEVTLADITFASIVTPSKEYMLTVENVSAVTSVTITIKTVAASLNGGTKYNTISQLSIPVSSSKSFILKGILVGADVRFTATPDASITDADAANRKITMRLRNY